MKRRLIAAKQSLQNKVTTFGLAVSLTTTQTANYSTHLAAVGLAESKTWGKARINDLRGHLNNPCTTTQSITAATAEWYANALADRHFAGALNAWLRDSYTTGRATIYDRAMDAVYNKTHIGGGYHRLFDGGHTLHGAWSACQGLGGSIPEDINGYLKALWKDLATPMGLPLATWDKATFDALSTSLNTHFGISRYWLAHAVSTTATQMVSDASSVLAVALHWRAEDRSRFSELVGSLGISAIAGANPLLALISLVCLARAYQQSRLKGGWRTLTPAISRGGIGSAAFVVASSVAPGVLWVGLLTGLCAAILARRAHTAAEDAINDMEWGSIAEFLTTMLRMGAKVTTTSTPA